MGAGGINFSNINNALNFTRQAYLLFDILNDTVFGNNSLRGRKQKFQYRPRGCVFQFILYAGHDQIRANNTQTACLKCFPIVTMVRSSTI